MDPVITILILLGAVALLGAFINKRISELGKGKNSEELLRVIEMLKDGSQEDRRLLMSTLEKNTQSLNARLDNAARVIGEVKQNVGEMSEIGRSMQELQEFLQSPKLRGNVGEQVLKELLRQFLPKKSFHLQYSFKSGEKVDAAIETSAGIVPIDSKFPMENFRKMMERTGEERTKAEREFVRDVKKHIDSISKKYILTEEGTIDYALMYVPSEAVYYEIVNHPTLFEHAGKKQVLPVSPTTFYAYMRAILMSFEGQKIEARAKEILSTLRAVQKDYEKVEDNLSILQKHVNNANNMMGSVLSSFGMLGQKIARTGSLGEEEAKNELE